ncbi:MAG: RDD family protein [Pseudomonadota bacterium]|nr:RDD family protein [Pseudomonadota bacterium]
MNMYLLRRLGFLFALLCVTAVAGHPGAAVSKTATPKTTAPAAAASTATTDDHSATAAPAAADTDDFNDEPESVDRHDRLDWRNRIETRHRRHRHDTNDNNIVSIGHSSHLQSGEKADSVVSVFGSSTSEGEAVDVVSVMGNTRVTGPVHDSAVAVLGNAYIDSKVDGDVVAVLGNVTLGPNAEIGGDVVAVLGTMQRDPAAIIHGSVQRILNFDAGGAGGFNWLNTWITHCLLYARPLALVHGLGWAWTLALGLLAFYACLALLFRSSVDLCVQTLESEPGHTALAALIGILLTPVLLVLLCVTVIGIAAVPFVVGALFCMSLFGKAVMLAWLGGRVSGKRPGPAGHPAVAILIGGALVLVLYVVPVVGFLVYKLLGFFGFGAVVYTLVLRARARRAVNGASPPPRSATAPDLRNTATSASATMAPATMAGAGWTASAAPAAGAAAAAEGAAATPDSSAVGGPVPPASAPPPSAPPAFMPPHITAAMPRAGFWIRMAALLLDVLLVGFLMSVLQPFGNFHIVVLAIYGAVMWKLRGTTVGGIVFDLHVVRLDGRPVDWETAIVRALGCFLSLFVVFLGFIWIAFDHDSQAWHDKIAGTVVVRAKRGAPLL